MSGKIVSRQGKFFYRERALLWATDALVFWYMNRKPPLWKSIDQKVIDILGDDTVASVESQCGGGGDTYRHIHRCHTYYRHRPWRNSKRLKPFCSFIKNSINLNYPLQLSQFQRRRYQCHYTIFVKANRKLSLMPMQQSRFRSICS